MADEHEVLRHAEYYVNTMGFSVIPVQEDKKPAIKSWKEYQERKPTQDEIRKWFKGTGLGVGVVCGRVSNICVVDVDSQRGLEELKRVAPAVLNAPSVSTPRGGKHFYFRTGSEVLGNTAGRLHEVDFRGEGGYVVAPPSKYINGAGYEWDVPLSEARFSKLPDEYVSAVSRLVHSSTSLVREDASVFTVGKRHGDLLRTVNYLVRGGMKYEEVVAIAHYIASKCGKGKKEATDLVTWALQNAESRERNLTEEVKDYVEKTDGAFSMHDMCIDLGLHDKSNKNKASVIMGRLKDGGTVRKYGERTGVYIKVDDSLEAIDWMNADMKPMRISLPFNMHELVNTFPNNIIVVAGAPDAGKTAFFLDFIKRNMDDYNIHYFNSEMGPSEMRVRILNHDDLEPEEWRFSAWNRTTGFADCIQPDAINIIDFLEINDTFYKIAGEINDIYRKLDGGLALVGLQKGWGQDLGRGGTFSLEKPRLYVSLDSGKIKIVKAKNWVDPTINPNGLTKSFSLVGGAKFIYDRGWEREEKKEKANVKKDNPLTMFNRAT